MDPWVPLVTRGIIVYQGGAKLQRARRHGLFVGNVGLGKVGRQLASHPATRTTWSHASFWVARLRLRVERISMVYSDVIYGPGCHEVHILTSPVLGAAWVLLCYISLLV